MKRRTQARGHSPTERSKARWVYLAVSVLVIGFAGCDNVPGLTGPFSVAPGLNITIDSVVIPGDLQPVITFTATDDNGNTIPLAEFTDARFILAFLETPDEGSTARFVNYTTTTEEFGDVVTIQATFDGERLGGVVQNPDGSMTYRFSTVLPDDFARAATHQLGGQFRRVWPVDGKTYRNNAIYTFRPDGGDVANVRDIVNTDTCNECHTRLALHGGSRREVQLCILCHNAQTVDANSGNPVDFPFLIHKIHHGSELAEPFQIFGFGDRLHDYSTVEFPQDIRNCTVCHQGSTQSDVYKNSPTLEGCASCHDRTWFGARDQTPDGYANHIGGMHDNNSACHICHAPPPIGNGVAPVDIMHTIETDLFGAPGLAFEITDVRTSEGGTIVTFDFLVTDHKTGEPIADMAAEGIQAGTVLAWPVPEYRNNISELFIGFGPTSPGLLNNGGGSYTYTLSGTIPGGSHTYALAMQARRSFIVLDGDEEVTFRQGIIENARTTFRVDSGVPDVRRQVVDEQNCVKCHKEIRMHGDLRTGVNLCVMCHHTRQTDIAFRDGSDDLHLVDDTVTVNFKDMVHRIHTGEELESDYTVIGFSGSVHDFTEVRFPGDRRDCSICHDGDSYEEMPLPMEVMPTEIDNTITIAEISPQRAACTSCHDNALANVHAIINTDVSTMTESCAVCHGPGRVFSVENVHEIEP